MATEHKDSVHLVCTRDRHELEHWMARLIWLEWLGWFALLFSKGVMSVGCSDADVGLSICSWSSKQYHRKALLALSICNNNNCNCSDELFKKHGMKLEKTIALTENHHAASYEPRTENRHSRFKYHATNHARGLREVNSRRRFPWPAFDLRISGRAL